MIRLRIPLPLWAQLDIDLPLALEGVEPKSWLPWPQRHRATWRIYAKPIQFDSEVAA